MGKGELVGFGVSNTNIDQPVSHGQKTTFTETTRTAWNWEREETRNHDVWYVGVLVLSVFSHAPSLLADTAHAFPSLAYMSPFPHNMSGSALDHESSKVGATYLLLPFPLPLSRPQDLVAAPGKPSWIYAFGIHRALLQAPGLLCGDFLPRICHLLASTEVPAKTFLPLHRAGSLKAGSSTSHLTVRQ